MQGPEDRAPAGAPERPGGGAPAAPSRKRVRRALLAIIGAVLFFVLAGRLEEFYGLEAAARDWQASLRGSALDSNVVLVTITDRDYGRYFGGRSPLDPDVLDTLLRAIAAGAPRAIGVDLDTAHPGFARMPPPGDSPPIIWAQEAVGCDEARGVEPPAAGVESAGETRPEAPSDSCAATALVPQPVLGGRDSAVRAGLVANVLDRKGTVRLYSPFLATTNGILPSFAYLVAAASAPGARPGPVSGADSTALRFISFHRDAAWHFSVQQILAMVAESGTGYTGPRGVLHDRIVLLGGSYRAGRDEHHTPLGMMAGVTIQGQTVETVLDGGGDPSPSLVSIAVLQFLAGASVVVLFLRFSPGGAMLLTLFAFPGVAVLGSLVLTRSAVAGLPYFAPLLIFMIIQQLYDQASLYRDTLIEEFYRQARGGGRGEEAAQALLDSVEARVDRLETGLGRMASRWLRRKRPDRDRDETAAGRTGAGPVGEGTPAEKPPDS